LIAQDAPTQVAYRCMECNTSVKLDLPPPEKTFAPCEERHIRCPGCGYHVLFKERTKRRVQYEAR
jgi:DNA-directed RNA polymerase subunit RPC12/RpoP